MSLTSYKTCHSDMSAAMSASVGVCVGSLHVYPPKKQLFFPLVGNFIILKNLKCVTAQDDRQEQESGFLYQLRQVCSVVFTSCLCLSISPYNTCSLSKYSVSARRKLNYWIFPFLVFVSHLSSTFILSLLDFEFINSAKT